MENQLGINTVHIKVEEIRSMGFNRLEVCLGRLGTYEERLQKAENEIYYAEDHELAYSVHLPIYLYEWFNGDYLDAFYLDSNVKKREMSFRLLEANLEALKDAKAEYYVIHFPGVYLKPHMDESAFELLLEESLKRVNEIAKRVDKKILLEYFGSNALFSDYREWVKRITPYSHLGLLTDTGHLYYASLMHQFDFCEGFRFLSQHSDAFHLWTTLGNKPYSANPYYKQYHHISAHPEQRRCDGWAFDAETVFKHLLSCHKPIVIEATPLYEGVEYFYRSIEALQAIAFGKE